jgi:hypothetical protein
MATWPLVTASTRASPHHAIAIPQISSLRDVADGRHAFATHAVNFGDPLPRRHWVDNVNVVSIIDIGEGDPRWGWTIRPSATTWRSASPPTK